MTTNATFNRYLLSSLTTFITVAAVTLSLQLTAGPIVWTSAFWFTVGMTVVRAAFKAVVEGFAGTNADA